MTGIFFRLQFFHRSNTLGIGERVPLREPGVLSHHAGFLLPSAKSLQADGCIFSTLLMPEA
jgi:hypothetical protein